MSLNQIDLMRIKGALDCLFIIIIIIIIFFKKFIIKIPCINLMGKMFIALT